MTTSKVAPVQICLKDNSACPWVEAGTAGRVVAWRNDGGVLCSFGTDPNYRVVVDSACIEIAPPTTNR